jgi:DeoR/GlpR family transcriptional regulator of sugar metabolism
MEEYLIEKKRLTVITNNIMLVVNLSKYDINVICLGGVVVEAPCMLFGTETVENAEKYKVDKMFFSTEALSLKGEISSGSYDLMLKTVSKNANKIFYLVDHKKIGKSFSRVYSNLSNVDYVISDYNFSTETTSAFPNTKFVNANEK